MAVDESKFETNHALDDFEIHSAETYFDRVRNDIDRAVEDSFVSMTSMGFDPDSQQVDSIVSALVRAAKRGVITSLGIDNFAFLDKSGLGPVGSVPLGALRYYGAQGEVLDALQTIDARNLFIGATNYPRGISSLTYSGRSHVKSATIGDKVYVGGISLEMPERIDAMASFHNPEAAQWITRMNRMSIIKQSVGSVLEGRDQSIVLDEPTDSKLLVDAGVRGQSVIYDEVIAIIDDANEELFYVSEQFPMGKVGRHLLRAYERGVNITIPVNGPEKHDRYQLIHKFILDRAISRYPADFFAHRLPDTAPTMHAKMVASESRAMIGSHNLNGIVVTLGTAEMDVVSSNPSVVQAVSNFVKDNIATERS